MFQSTPSNGKEHIIVCDSWDIMEPTGFAKIEEALRKHDQAIDQLKK